MENLPQPQDFEQPPAQFHTGRPIVATPKIMLMGLKRSGKSSVANVVFRKLPSRETLHLEPTTKPERNTMRTFMDIDIIDSPFLASFPNGHDSRDTLREAFASVSTLIWVIDAQDEYLEALEKLTTTIIALFSEHPYVNIEVFVHKSDSLSDEFKGDVFRDMQARVLEELADAGAERALVDFHQTSIYNASIYVAFSKVIQKLIPQLATLESLLDSLVSNCAMDKAYLFDVETKLYVASDSSPADVGQYETCSDHIDLVVDISAFYDWERPANEDEGLPVEYNSVGTESLITMESRGKALYMRGMQGGKLALMCILGSGDPGDVKTLIDYNVTVIQKAIETVFAR